MEMKNHGSLPCSCYFDIPFRYIHPDMTLAPGEINSIRDENLQELLPRKKLQLVLDLDHTLIHAIKIEKLTLEEKESMKSMDDVYGMFGGRYLVKFRPGIREFLKEVSSMFDVSICTMARRAYAKEVNRLLESESGFPKDSWVIGKDDCVKGKMKRLELVLSHERVVLIVDDTQKIWGEIGKRNLVMIGQYNFFPIKKGAEEVDTELGRVLKILKEVHSVFFKGNLEFEEDYVTRDVREVLNKLISSKNLGDHEQCNDNNNDPVDGCIEDMSDVPTKRCKIFDEDDMI